MPWLDLKISPEIIRKTLDPTSGQSVRFSMDIHPRTRPGVYYMMLCAIGDLGISVTSKPFRIEAAG